MKHAWTIPDILLTVVLGLALVGLFWVPYDPSAQTFRDHAFALPSWAHPFGIDGLGRDFLSRLWRGLAHTTLMAGSALAVNLVLAGALVALAEGGPRWTQRTIPALISLWVAVPVILIGLILLVFLSPSAPTLITAAALGNVPLTFRQLRIYWREQRRALYVQASEVLGAPRRHLLFWTIGPNLRPDLFALGKLVFAISVLELSGLAFLGLIGDPDFAELGAILRQNQAYLFQAPMLVIAPGILLSGLLLLVHLGRRS